MADDNFYEDDEDSKKSKKPHDYEALAVSNIMKNEDCRKFMWDNLQSCGVFTNMFDKDSAQHAYNAGLRAAGLQLETKLKEHEPFYYMKMIKENIDG